jgi:copper(I)-binding protein
VRTLFFVVLMATGLAHGHSHEKGDLQVRHPWSRATPPGAKVGVTYMEIRNSGAKPARLVGASTPLARKVEMHVTTHEGGVARMREVKGLEVPAGERLELRPGGSHFMLVDLVRPLAKGERIPLTLRFEGAGEMTVEVEVQELGSRHPRH